MASVGLKGVAMRAAYLLVSTGESGRTDISGEEVEDEGFEYG